MKEMERDASVAGFIDSRFDEGVEEGCEIVVILGLDGVVFVIVAFGASGGEAQPDGSEGPDVFAFEGVKCLLFDDAGFAICIDEAIVGGRGEGSIITIREEVAGELLARELIKGHVRVQGLDDVFAVRAGCDGFVGNHAIGIGMANEVQPDEPLVFGVLEGGEPLIEKLLVVAI